MGHICQKKKQYGGGWLHVINLAACIQFKTLHFYEEITKPLPEPMMIQLINRGRDNSGMHK